MTLRSPRIPARETEPIGVNPRTNRTSYTLWLHSSEQLISSAGPGPRDKCGHSFPNPFSVSIQSRIPQEQGGKLQRLHTPEAAAIVRPAQERPHGQTGIITSREHLGLMVSGESGGGVHRTKPPGDAASSRLTREKLQVAAKPPGPAPCTALLALFFQLLTEAPPQEPGPQERCRQPASKESS